MASCYGDAVASVCVLAWFYEPVTLGIFYLIGKLVVLGGYLVS